METLAGTFAVEQLMLERGARTNGEFLKLGLVYEISPIMFPAISGKSHTPAVFEGGEGLADKVRLSLESFEAGPFGTVHLRYDVTH